LEAGLAAKKGIRINELAKELGVESKAILAKLREEFPDDPTPNHQSSIPLGLAETIREWRSSGALGPVTVVVAEAAPAVAAADDTSVSTKVKGKRPAAGKRQAGGDDEDSTSDGGNVAVAEPPQAGELPDDAADGDEPAADARPPETQPAAAPAADRPAVAAPVVNPQPAAPATAAPVPAGPLGRVMAPPAIPGPPRTQFGRPGVAAPPAAAPPAGPPALRPAALGPTGGPPIGSPGALRGLSPLVPPVTRPTLTIGSTKAAGTAPRPVQVIPVGPPQMLTPSMLTKPTMQGPKVIRVEKPDMVAAPRKPGGPRGRDEGPTPGYNTARPTTGRGVKVTAVDEDEEAAKKKAALVAKKSGGTLSGRRRGIDGRRGEADERVKDFSEADLAERKIRLANSARYVAGVSQGMDRANRQGKQFVSQRPGQRGEPVEIEEPITPRTLAAALGLKVNDVISKLMRAHRMMVTINQVLTADVAALVAMDFGIDLQVAEQTTLEEDLLREFDARERDPADVVARPPVVTILGHVDHGKTSLLDKIRSANVAAGEAGGITQHTAAWTVEVKGSDGQPKRVTFIDTPGHQAFTAMRARGATMTDVVVLVVGAVEGVSEQTIESINHARAAKVPIVVAMNKMDRPDANPDMVLGQLAAQGLNPVEWGGDIEVVRTSAVTGMGVQELIEILDYQSQLLDLKADPTGAARGVVIEARIDPGLGSVATVLVQDGTLSIGDTILSGQGYGRIRALRNDRGRPTAMAGPSTPVVVSGLNNVPNAGDKFYVVDDLERARLISEEREMLQRQKELAAKNTSVTTADALYAQMRTGQIKTINLIIKADVQGSVETLVNTVGNQNTEEVRIRVIHSAVGGITESDVNLAAATKDVNESTVIIGFHVVADEMARQKAEQLHVEMRTYTVIYEIFDDLKKALSGMLEPEVREKLHGHVEVRKVIKVSKLGNIAGCFVLDGHVQRGSKIRLSRGGILVAQDIAIDSLKRVKDDVREVKAGLECGIKLAGYDDIKEGDILEAYIRETFQRTL
jgi:translation initiation factor IF-2